MSDHRYWAWVDNKMYGPYGLEELRDFCRPETYLCREGEEEWRFASEYDDLSAIFDGSPEPEKIETGWFVRRSDGTEFGPVRKRKLIAWIEAGEITETDLVKHSNWKQWRAGRATRLFRKAPSGRDHLPPQLEEFYHLCLEASDDEILKQAREHWTDYTRPEKAILKEELDRRGLKR